MVLTKRCVSGDLRAGHLPGGPSCHRHLGHGHLRLRTNGPTGVRRFEGIAPDSQITIAVVALPSTVVGVLHAH